MSPQSAKRRCNSFPAQRGRGKTRSAQTCNGRKRAWADLPRILSLLTGFPAAFLRQLYDSLFTAADGKIPLSMVQVKFKPQYLVFSMHSLVTGHQTLGFGCGKAQRGRQGKGNNDLTASKIVQILPGNNSENKELTRPTDIPKPSPPRLSQQGARPVHFWVPLCMLWTTEEFLSETLGALTWQLIPIPCLRC